MRQKFFHGLNPRGFHRLSYYEWGSKDAARTVVCVHGLTRNAHDFDWLAEALSADMRVIAVDVAGRGDSERLPDPLLYAYPQYLNDMTALLARLDVASVDWVGSSMGGLIGMQIAAHPGNMIRRMVLNDVGPYLPAMALARIAAYISAPPTFGTMAEAEIYIRARLANFGPCTEADYKALARHGVTPLPDGGFAMNYDPGVALNFALIKQDVDLWPVYERIACPVLVLRGGISDVLTAETAAAMTQRGPRAELITVPGIGHCPALTDAAQIGAIRDFLNR